MFQIPGVGLMAAMAHRSSASGSAVYLWTHSGFQLYQNISTYGALAWRHFRMGKRVRDITEEITASFQLNINLHFSCFVVSIQMFLVVSNSGAGTDKQLDKESEMDFSVIYKWSNRRKRFVPFQTLQTYCARDWEAFSISQHTYLAVANHRQGKMNHL